MHIVRMRREVRGKEKGSGDMKKLALYDQTGEGNQYNFLLHCTLTNLYKSHIQLVALIDPS